MNQEGEGWIWEWEWICIVPREGGEGGGESCVYEGGETIELPGKDNGRFLGGGMGKQFEEGVPLFFMVKVRVRREGGSGEVIAEGTWEKVFSIMGEDEGVQIEESRWICENGAVGYLVRDFILLLVDCVFLLMRNNRCQSFQMKILSSILS